MADNFDLKADSRELDALVKRLALSTGVFRQGTVQALKDSATTIRNDEGRAALQLPNTTGVHTGLRVQISQATTVRDFTSRTDPAVEIFINESQVRGRLGGPTNRARGWRHPVFGNRSVIVQQIMSPGWWDRGSRHGVDDAPRKVLDALVATARMIAKG